MKRINRYLNSQEIDEASVTSLPDHENAITMKHSTFTWNECEPPLLRNINLDIGHGKLIAIVGHVGAGKSSLLSAMLGDMQKLAGKVNVDGKVAYMSQQAWIQNTTLRKNITFTRSFDERRYNKIIQACCLEPDIRILAGGDQTEIGERGINLSGGQKQRIALARAVYSGANILLLDDPLSAVDAHVGRKLFENVIGNCGLLRNKTRVLVTHRVAFLPEVDEIIVMKNNEISERGTINELVERQGAFAEFIAEYLDEKWLGEENGGNGQADDVNQGHRRISTGPTEDPEMMRSLVEVVKPILERTKSRTDSMVATTETTIDSLLESVLAKSDRSLSGSLVDSKKAAAATTATVFATSMTKKSREIADQKSAARGKLIGAEVTETGSVRLAVYFRYFQVVGLLISFIILSGLVAGNVMQVLGALWLSDWSNDALDPVTAADEGLRTERLIGYTIYGTLEIIFSLISGLVLNIACIKAAKALHNEMLKSVLFAPMSFFGKFV